jgi:hypothetical protein
MTGSISSLATTLPTPAHSVNGSSLPYPEMAHETNMSDDTPQKRKRALEDMGDREQKKVHIEDRKLGIEDLHLDVGEKYLLCRTRKAPFVSKVFSPPQRQWPCDLVSYGLSHGSSCWVKTFIFSGLVNMTSRSAYTVQAAVAG